MAVITVGNFVGLPCYADCLVSTIVHHLQVRVFVADFTVSIPAELLAKLRTVFSSSSKVVLVV